jgi:hypothetical protein
LGCSLPETWQAFNRYTAALLAFPDRHPLRVPARTDRTRSYTSLDEDLVRWHAGMSAVYDQCASMAVVGSMSDNDLGLEFEFDRQAGAELRALKAGFYLRRDLPIIAYLLLSALSYLTRSVPLALLVLCFNVVNLAICLRLKSSIWRWVHDLCCWGCL